MSGKFMKVKKIIIPTLTMIIIASQLMGCAAATQSELLQMINQGDQIEIEVASPLAEEEQGEESSILWEELASLTTNPDLRSEWDNILGIMNTDTGKNGVLYVNTEGENDNNNTLRVALHNREFLKFLENESSISELSTAVQNNYADLEADEEMKSVYMGINGYFNLLPDSTPNYSNPDSTLTRAEFMSMVMRAETPVQDITADTKFANAVGQSDYNIYAQEVANDNYLDLSSKSLNNMTYNGTITRAEAIYLLMNHYFADELKTIDTTKTKTTFTDAKDGGNIAVEQKFIENATQKDYWKSYELTYVLQNPETGLPTDLYKAIVLAEQKGLITDETRWDEGITRAEAIEFLVNTLKIETGIEVFSAKQGIIEGYEVKEEEETKETANAASSNAEIETPEDAAYQNQLDNEDAVENKDADDVVESDIEAIDKTMYAKGSVNTRSGPSTDYKIVGGLSTNQEVKVTGQSKSTGWYEIEINGEKQFVSNKYLSDTKVEVTQPSPTTDNNTGNTGNTSNDDGGNSPTGAGTTTPGGHKVGRGPVNRKNSGGGNSGGSGEGNNVIWQ